jgi:hypothetical protein
VISKVFPFRVVVSLALAVGIVGGIVAAGAALRRDDNGAAQSKPSAPTTSTSTTTTVPPTTTTTLPPFQQPAAVDLPDVQLVGWGSGSRNAVILFYEQRMVDVHLDPGPVDGLLDQRTVYALQAVEKLAGIDRAGRLGPAEAAFLESFQYPLPLHPTAEGNRTEIDVTKQVLTLYEGYQVRLITTTSTASGEHYCYNTPRVNPTQHVCEVATTPSGRFTYYFFYKGWHKGVLGSLYNPFYFNKGIAVHGYQDVPPTPASHGCTRIPMHIAEYFYTLVHQGDPVYVDGGQDAQILSSEPIGGGGGAPAPHPTPIPPPGEPAPAPPAPPA